MGAESTRTERLGDRGERFDKANQVYSSEISFGRRLPLRVGQSRFRFFRGSSADPGTDFVQRRMPCNLARELSGGSGSLPAERRFGQCVEESPHGRSDYVVLIAKANEIPIAFPANAPFEKRFPVVELLAQTSASIGRPNVSSFPNASCFLPLNPSSADGVSLYAIRTPISIAATPRRQLFEIERELRRMPSLFPLEQILPHNRSIRSEVFGMLTLFRLNDHENGPAKRDTSITTNQQTNPDMKTGTSVTPRPRAPVLLPDAAPVRDVLSGLRLAIA